jgi:hypothetical protein
MSEIPKLGCISHDQERRKPPTDIAAYIDWILRGGRFDSGHREPQPTREWVGLTDDEAARCWTTSTVKTWKNIETALKEKNT